MNHAKKINFSISLLYRVGPLSETELLFGLTDMTLDGTLSETGVRFHNAKSLSLVYQVVENGLLGNGSKHRYVLGFAGPDGNVMSIYGLYRPEALLGDQGRWTRALVGGPEENWKALLGLGTALRDGRKSSLEVREEAPSLDEVPSKEEILVGSDTNDNVTETVVIVSPEGVATLNHSGQS